MSIEKYIVEHKEILDQLESRRREKKHTRTVLYILFSILFLTPFILVFVVSHSLAVSFIVSIIAALIIRAMYRSKKGLEKFQIESDKLLIDHFWNKKHKIRKSKKQYYEGGRPFIKETLPSELFCDLNEDLKRRYEERSFYSAKLGTTEFQCHCLKYGTSEMDDHGRVDMKKELGTFDFFRLQNTNWSLQKCFILPKSKPEFHKKELYGFQQEIRPANLTKNHRMYTNNKEEADLYLILFAIIQKFNFLIKRQDIRLVFKEDTIMIAMERKRTAPFSASINSPIKGGSEIKRIDQSFLSLKSMVKELEQQIKEGLPNVDSLPTNQST
ncbi:MAG: hypothetical protein BM555_02405 [Crocinitomix sp. MedPE-SWsnd]|nr:MAG: hypothetical protein BM555_02405 [Crocinitomix sp. MedPE-SWsnd]